MAKKEKKISSDKINRVVAIRAYLWGRWLFIGCPPLDGIVGIIGYVYADRSRDYV